VAGGRVGLEGVERELEGEAEGSLRDPEGGSGGNQRKGSRRESRRESEGSPRELEGGSGGSQRGAGLLRREGGRAKRDWYTRGDHNSQPASTRFVATAGVSVAHPFLSCRCARFRQKRHTAPCHRHVTRGL
jgi:hypothetical protein